MDTPQELKQMEADARNTGSQLGDVLNRLETFRAAHSRFDKFSASFYEIDTCIRKILGEYSELKGLFEGLFDRIEQEAKDARAKVLTMDREPNRGILYIEEFDSVESAKTYMESNWREFASTYPLLLVEGETDYATNIYGEREYVGDMLH